MANDILSKTTKPKLERYIHASLFRPTTTSLLKAIRQGFLKKWPELIENLIKKHLEKSRNTTMGHLYMIRQGLQSTIEKPPDTDLEDKRKKISVLYTCGP